MLTLTGKGNDLKVPNLSSRIAMYFWSIGSLIIYFAFISSLVARLSIPSVEKSMDSWQDLIDNNYTILSQVDDMGCGLTVLDMYLELDEEAGVTTYSKILQKIREGRKNHGSS